MSELSTRRILEGPLGREVARFGTPLALGMGLQTTFNLVDAYLIARLEPYEAGPALGAVGICDQMGALGSIVSYGLSIATAAVVSRKRGQGDEVAVRRVAFQSLLMVMALGAAFALLGVFGSELLMRDVMQAKGDVARLGANYLQVQMGGSITIFLLLHLTTLQRALGSSKTPVSMLLLANVLNLGLAVLLMYGPGPAPEAFGWCRGIASALGIPRMGLMGAAWATVLARLVVLLPTWHLVRSRFGLFSVDSREKPAFDIIRHLAHLAWPSSTQLVVRIVGMLITQALVAWKFTTETNQQATTALGVVFRLETMALFVSLGWGSAAQTFVGQNLGAGHRARAQASGWCVAAYDALMMMGLAVLYWNCGRGVIAFFDPRPEVISVGLSYLRTVAFAYFGLGVGIALGSAIQGAGATRLTLAVDAGVILGFQLPLSLAVIVLGGGLTHLWLVVGLTYALFAGVYGLVYKRGAFLATQV